MKRFFIDKTNIKVCAVKSANARDAALQATQARWKNSC